MVRLYEVEVESAALDWLAALGWTTALAPTSPRRSTGVERADYGQVVLERRRRDHLARLNQNLPNSALDDAIRQFIRPE